MDLLGFCIIARESFDKAVSLACRAGYYDGFDDGSEDGFSRGYEAGFTDTKSGLVEVFDEADDPEETLA